MFLASFFNYKSLLGSFFYLFCFNFFVNGLWGLVDISILITKFEAFFQKKKKPNFFFTITKLIVMYEQIHLIIQCLHLGIENIFLIIAEWKASTEIRRVGCEQSGLGRWIYRHFQQGEGREKNGHEFHKCHNFFAVELRLSQRK